MAEQDDIGNKPLLAYLGAICLCAALALGIAWTYTSTQGSRFLESGYAVWHAKGTLLRECDLGDVAVFGDSRADSAVIPSRLSKPATNLGFAGGTPIENYFFVKSLLSCKTRPRTLILSFNPNAFEIVQPWLWDNAVRYRALGWNEISLVRQEALRLDERSYFAAKPHIGIDGLFRDITYSTHFPAIYFNSLVESRLALRTDRNREKFAEVIRTRGYPSYGNGQQAPVRGLPLDARPFAPLPLQQRFFDMTVAMLDRAGIDTYFLITPYSTQGAHAHAQRYMDAYLAFVRQAGARYPHFHLLQQQVPVWPDAMFVDGQHLSEPGADAFSRQLDRCLEDAACGFEWIDRAATARM